MAKIVAFDVDGVLANFITSHLDLIEEIVGKKLPKMSDTFPDKWDYHLPALTKEEDKKVWDIIAASPSFWYDLQPLDEPLLERLGSFSDNNGSLYFITNRFGNDAKRQTEEWLSQWIYLPTVIVAKDKAPILRSLKAALFVDDKPENCIEASKVDGLKVLMPDRSYNRWIDPEGVSRTRDVVSDIEEYLK